MPKKKPSPNAKGDGAEKTVIKTPLSRTLELTAFKAVVVPIRSTTLALLLNRRVSADMLDQITSDLLTWLKSNPTGLQLQNIEPLTEPRQEPQI